MRTPRWLAVVAALAVAGAACGDDAGDADDAGDPGPGDEPPATEAPAPEPPPGALDEVGDEAWTRLADAPTAVTEVDAAVFADELWTVGGFLEDGTVTTAVQIYDPRTDTWREGPDLPAPVHHPTLVATDTDLVVIGGFRSVAFDAVDDVLVLDDQGGGWTPGPSLPAPRGAGGAAWDGTRVVFGGGMHADGLGDEIWALTDVRDGEWSDVGRLSVARDHLDATSDAAGTVWFLAGREMSLDRNLGVVEVLDADGVRVLGDLLTPRGGVAAFHVDGLGACLAGGEELPGTFGEVECVDAQGGVTELPGLGEARHGLGAGVIDGVALVVLGGPEPLLSVSGTTEALRVVEAG